MSDEQVGPRRPGIGSRKLVGLVRPQPGEADEEFSTRAVETLAAGFEAAAAEGSASASREPGSSDPTGA